MIVLRISSGLANAMYEFAAGYALARTLRVPLELDISAYASSAWTFQLDRFNIPGLEKISYEFPDPEDTSHTSSTNMPPELLGEHGRAYSDCNASLPRYEGLEQAAVLQGSPIVLCGYFFPREQNYRASNAPYWGELRALFTPREPNPVLERFEELAAGYDTVGVHIRRGDFLVADFAWLPTADYFRAAIAWFRKRLARPRFFIFSDDISYARNILGLDSTFFYVHPLGHDAGSFAEFLCLARCKHKIVSNDSTFSRLACELHDSFEQIVLHRERETLPGTWRQTVNRGLQFVRKRLRTLCFGPSLKDVWMDRREEAAWRKRFTTDGGNPLGDYPARVSRALDCADDAAAVRAIHELFMNVAELSDADRTALAWRTLTAYLHLEQPDAALDLAYEFWYAFDDRPEFHRLYATALQDAGYAEEAAVEFSRCAGMGRPAENIAGLVDMFSACGRHRFLVLPHSRLRASAQPGNGLSPLGVTLRRLGHAVSFLFCVGMGEAEDMGERFYIESNPMLTTRAGVCLGCTQACREDVERQPGLETYLKNFVQSSPAAVMVTDDAPLRDIALRCGLRTVFCGAASDGKEGRLLNIAVASAPSQGYSLQKGRWRARQNHRLRTADIDCAARICRWLSRSGNDS